MEVGQTQRSPGALASSREGVPRPDGDDRDGRKSARAPTPTSTSPRARSPLYARRALPGRHDRAADAGGDFLFVGRCAPANSAGQLYRGISPRCSRSGSTAARCWATRRFKPCCRASCRVGGDGAGVAAGDQTVCLHPLDTLTCRGRSAARSGRTVANGRSSARSTTASGTSSPAPPAAWGVGSPCAAGCRRAAGARRHEAGLARAPSSAARPPSPTAVHLPARHAEEKLQASGGSAGAVVQPRPASELLRLYRGYGPRFFIVAANGGLAWELRVRAEPEVALRPPAESPFHARLQVFTPPSSQLFDSHRIDSASRLFVAASS